MASTPKKRQRFKPIPKLSPDESTAFWSNVDVVPGICWEWRLSTNNKGYGQYYRVPGDKYVAHRVAYNELVGPILSGMELDHQCLNKRCCNPDHLLVVTHRQNILRGHSVAAKNARKTHCPNGHPFTEANTKWAGSNRRCRTCCNQLARQRYAEGKHNAHNR